MLIKILKCHLNKTNDKRPEGIRSRTSWSVGVSCVGQWDTAWRLAHSLAFKNLEILSKTERALIHISLLSIIIHFDWRPASCYLGS